MSKTKTDYSLEYIMLFAIVITFVTAYCFYKAGYSNGELNAKQEHLKSLQRIENTL